MEGISDDDDEGEVSEASKGSHVSEPAFPMGSGGPDTGLAMVQDLESPDIQASQPRSFDVSDEEDVVPAIAANPKSESATSPSTYPDIDLESKNQRIKELQLMIARTKKEHVSMNFDLYIVSACFPSFVF